MRKIRTTSPWNLLSVAARGYLQWWKVYTAVVLAGLLPMFIFSGLSESPADSSAYAILFTGFFLFVALLSVANRQVSQDPRPTLRQAYFQGTAHTLSCILTVFLLFAYAFLAVPVGAARLVVTGWQALGRKLTGALKATLRTILVLLGGVLTLALVAAAFIGWQLVSFFLAGADTGGISWIYFLTLLVVIPACYVTIRSAFAPYAAAVDGVTPIRAIALSRRLTRGRFLILLVRLALLALILIGLSLMAGLLMLLMGLAVHNAALVTAIFQILVNVICLPLSIIYLMYLYREIRRQAEPAE